jgi:hypothetical protein
MAYSLADVTAAMNAERNDDQKHIMVTETSMIAMACP